MKEKYYEGLLNINTMGEQSWDETKKCYHPYEPTPYFALDKLFENYDINETDSVIDLVDTGIANFNMGVLTSNTSTIQVDITISNAGASGTADTISVGAGSNGIIELTQLQGLTDKDVITNSNAAIVKIIVPLARLLFSIKILLFFRPAWNNIFKNNR